MIITHIAENTLCQGVYYFPMSEWFYGTCITCHFIYVHTTSVAVPALSFTKTQDAQQHYVQIAYTKLHLNETIWTGIHLYPYVKYGIRCTSIWEHHDYSNFCVCLFQILSKLDKKCGKYHVYPQ